MGCVTCCACLSARRRPARRGVTRQCEEFWREIKDATMARTRLLRNDGRDPSANGRAPTATHTTADARRSFERARVNPFARARDPAAARADLRPRGARARNQHGPPPHSRAHRGRGEGARGLHARSARPRSNARRDATGPSRAERPGARSPQPFRARAAPSSAAKRWLVAFALLAGVRGDALRDATVTLATCATRSRVNSSRGQQARHGEEHVAGGRHIPDED